MRKGGGLKLLPLPKICYTCPTMMKLGATILYLKKIQKYINGVKHPLILTDINSFSLEISNFCCIRKNKQKLHFKTFFLFFLTIFEFLKVFLINTIAILMMSPKLAAPDILKMKVYHKAILK